MLKELIKALYEIVKAIKGESNEQSSGESTWQDFLNIIFDNDPDTPKYYAYNADDSNYEVKSFKDIKINERLPVISDEPDLNQGLYSFVYDHQIEETKAYDYMDINYGYDNDNGCPSISLQRGSLESEITDINGKTWYRYYMD